MSPKNLPILFEKWMLSLCKVAAQKEYYQLLLLAQKESWPGSAKKIEKIEKHAHCAYHYNLQTKSIKEYKNGTY